MEKDGFDTFKVDSNFWVKPLKSTTYYLNSVNGEVQEYIEVFVYPPPKVNLGKDTTLCFGDSLELNGTSPGAKYYWSTGDTISELKIYFPGNYILEAKIGSCVSQDTIKVDYFEKPKKLEITGKTEFCLFEEESTHLKVVPFEEIYWSTGETSTEIVRWDTGKIYVQIVDENGCNQKDSVYLKNKCNLKIYFPNTFTPNGDNINDFFKPVGYGIKNMEIKILNRFGEVMFQGDGVDAFWDGKKEGDVVSDGIYIYQVKVYSQELIEGIQNFTGIINLFK